VTLATHTESEEFFCHPLFHRAEPVYTYNDVAPVDQPVQQDWTFEGIAKRYMALVAPAAAGIEIDEGELLDLGKMIADGHV
jgi:hypothetical protein